MKKAFIIAASLGACLILYFVEQVLEVDYITKTITKLILFTALPYIYIKLTKKPRVKSSFNNEIFDISTLKLGLILGVVSFMVVITAYLLIGRFIDFNGIALELQSKSNITSSNFIIVGLYITFGNSFLEEFFFRGFIFLNLFNQGYKKFAYIYSSVLFGLYHIAIFKTWFNPLLIGLALFGLIIIGVIFNYLDTKTNNFMNSWLVHILADSAIIIIGMKMFDIW